MIKANHAQLKIEIVEIKKDLHWLDEKINKIELQVTNHLPTKIDCLEEKIDNYRVNNQRWLTGILVSLIFLLIGTLLNLIR